MSNLSQAWNLFYKQQIEKANLEQNKFKQKGE